jgi:hypothetical protein
MRKAPRWNFLRGVTNGKKGDDYQGASGAKI